MPYRLVTTFRPLSVVGVGVSLWGAMDVDKATAWVGAATAVGAVLVPTLLDWYRKVKRAARDERAADIEAEKNRLIEEVRKRIELEAIAVSNKARIVALEAQLAVYCSTCPHSSQPDAKCRPRTPDPDLGPTKH